MYCSNCGNQLHEEDNYCQSCGAKRTSTAENKPLHIRKWHWIVPLLTLIIVVSSLGVYALSEFVQTNSAQEAFQKGENLALEGDYQKAKKSFERALEQRANFKSATMNLKLIQAATATDEHLHKAEKLQKDHKYEKAMDEIQAAETILSGYTGKFITQLEKEIKESRVEANVAQLRFEMKGKSTIEELEPILVKAEKLNIPEAKQIANKIRVQIADYAYTAASDLLKEKQFSAALASVTKGLSYEPENKKLTNLMATIKSEQKAFEHAEQKRIEQALLAASKEKEHNLNSAIEVTSIKTTLDEFGDVVVSGKVKSNATVPVSSIMISYTLTKKNGTTFNENEVYVYPDVLYPDETGSFEYTHYLVNEELNVKFNKATWYLQK
ncbi:zinc ribbon domain-containing protein [Pseudalkalibacillus decolorationis]|uniref:zinc ribbon domain-containing protein n=1 Tax=Pseudalkalibacillus decolorationis TaxID=163879 RepID=UPI00214766A4|nr:zinc ribbon domain-containing protein [Pseudalkalibacillus decolorationis]